MIQAIVGMWRKVGIDAKIEVYEIAKHFELRAAAQARAGGVLQLGQRDRRSDHLDRLRDVRPVAALGLEDRRSRRQDRPAVGREGRGEAHRRLEGGRQATSPSRAMCIPLLQYAQPIVYKSDLKVTPNVSGALQPTLVVEGLKPASKAVAPPARGARSVGDRRRRRVARTVACCSPSSVNRLAMALVTLFGRGGRRLRPAARRAGRPDRDDDLAGRERRPTSRRCERSTGSTRRSCAVLRSGSAGVLHGDFGTSISLHRDVLDAARRRGCRRRSSSPSWRSSSRSLLGGGVAVAGTLMRAHRWRSRSSTAVNGIMLAVPDFIWALALVLLFGVADPGLAAVRPHRSGARRRLRHAVLSASKASLTGRFARRRRHSQPHGHAGAGAGPAARRRDRAPAQGSR